MQPVVELKDLNKKEISNKKKAKNTKISILYRYTYLFNLKKFLSASFALALQWIEIVVVVFVVFSLFVNFFVIVLLSYNFFVIPSSFEYIWRMRLTDFC